MRLLKTDGYTKLTQLEALGKKFVINSTDLVMMKLYARLETSYKGRLLRLYKQQTYCRYYIEILLILY